jgi:heme-degrading monooxygenase HmoA
MPTIRENPDYVTQVNHIRVAPEDIDELISKMRRQLDTVISEAPGFISSSIHRSHDGHHVLNYVQFETARQFDDARALPAFQAQFAGYKALVIEGGPHLYDVVRVRERLAPLPGTPVL